MKKNEQSLRKLWDYNKRSNIHVIRVPVGEGRDEKVFKEIMTKKLGKFGKIYKTTDSRSHMILGRIKLRNTH